MTSNDPVANIDKFVPDLSKEAAMARTFMFWTNRSFDLHNRFQNVDELKAAITSLLAATGTLDGIENRQSEVTGTRSGARVSVVHMPISDRRFYQLVMGAGDTLEQTEGRAVEVAEKIRRFDVD